MIAWKTIASAPKNGTRIIISNTLEFATAEFCNSRWVVSPFVGIEDGLADINFEPTHWVIPELSNQEEPTS